MSDAADKTTDDKQQPPKKLSETGSSNQSPTGSKSTAFILFAIAADTTWRMFVPTLGGTVLGLWADKVWHTQPRYAITGLVVGILVTALLVRQLYKDSSKDVK